MIEGLLAVIGTLIILLLSWLVSMVREINKKLDLKLDKAEYEKDQSVLWKRVDHHTHNGEGRVVIVN